ncbi:uncharacterized protein C8R40DRAFT_1108305 [Lentinula edodes]|uniref:uncharacterized protein n=1 Tax=Lentinula edodes TaxID=5353 RepID=UPI001E8DAAE5|nr:uncharacterized protein C8R40DRAFT_1108305 [Lentinula edodes]KAH7874344.1 hypothetical protein C8R40DRAFT_1108305 [Lentinula edodes]
MTLAITNPRSAAAERFLLFCVLIYSLLMVDNLVSSPSVTLERVTRPVLTTIGIHIVSIFLLTLHSVSPLGWEFVDVSSELQAYSTISGLIGTPLLKIESRAKCTTNTVILART